MLLDEKEDWLSKSKRNFKPIPKEETKKKGNQKLQRKCDQL